MNDCYGTWLRLQQLQNVLIAPLLLVDTDYWRKTCPTQKLHGTCFRCPQATGGRWAHWLALKWNIWCIFESTVFINIDSRKIHLLTVKTVQFFLEVRIRTGEYIQNPGLHPESTTLIIEINWYTIVSKPAFTGLIGYSILLANIMSLSGIWLSWIVDVCKSSEALFANWA
jgi:hypothetical protein